MTDDDAEAVVGLTGCGLSIGCGCFVLVVKLGIIALIVLALVKYLGS